MPDVGFGNLLGVLVVAVLAPIVLGLAPRLRVPAVVLEIVLGVLLGPSLLGWLDADLAVEVVALLGLAMLLFLAGLEIDVTALRGALLKVALLGYVVSVAVGWVAGLGLDAAGWVDDPLLLAVTVSATSLGLVVAVLKDARAVSEPAGADGRRRVVGGRLRRRPAAVAGVLDVRRRHGGAAAAARAVRAARRGDRRGDRAVVAVDAARRRGPPAPGHDRRDPGPRRDAAADRLRGAGRGAGPGEHPRRVRGRRASSGCWTGTRPATRTSGPSWRRWGTAS